MSDIGTKRAALSMRGVSVVFRSGLRRRRALDDVSFSVDAGTTFGLIGPNGAGKSTLLRCVVGLLRPDAGTICLDGNPPARPRSRRRVGYLPDRLGYTARQTGRGYLHLHAALLGITADRTVRQAADRLGVLDYWHRPLREYSRGMLRKTGLAAATLCRPAILVLDEPTAGLDSGGSQRLRELVLAHRRNGGTAVISSHHLDEMTKICDHVVLLNEGRVRRRLDLRDLRSAPRYVVELGAPADPGTVDTLTIPGGALESIDGRTLHIRLESVKIAEDVLRHLVRAGLSVRTARLEEPDLKRFLAEEVPVE